MSDLLGNQRRPRTPPVVKAWDAFEPEPDAPCLFANGFIVVEGYPQNPQYPCLVLAPLTNTGRSTHYGVGLYLTPQVSRHTLEHPSHGRNVGELVDTLAQHIASARSTADIVDLTVDTPLPIYVVDPNWKPVAELFVAEFGKPVGEDTYSK